MIRVIVMMMGIPLFSAGLISQAWAAGCPGVDDEAALKTKTAAGPSVFVCGFEDHEIKAPAGRRAFSDFKVYAETPKGKEPALLFTSEVGTNFWVKSDSRSMELTELWYFSEKAEPALLRQVTCEAEACTVSPPKCVLKLKKNPYPKALARFQKQSPADLGSEGEDMIDQIFAQALVGDAAALKFFEAMPQNLDPRYADVFESDQRKIKQAKELKCP